MQFSIAGLIVCMAILAVGYYCRGTLIVGLLASMAFGSTAIVTLSSLGGSSPLIYTFFVGLMLLAVAARRKIWQDLGYVFGNVGPFWPLAGLVAYVVIGAWVFPRLFAGQTFAFVQSTVHKGRVVEAALAPISGNITQSGYFVLGGLTAVAFCILLLRGNRIVQVRRGFFAWCILHAAMGLIDFVGKLAGAGDLLKPIRTASYAFLTEAVQAGFWRIAGAYSEASAFGGASLACLAFAYTYWRKTGSGLAKWLSVILFALTLLSTSSTAYVGLAIISMPVVFSLLRAFVSGRLVSQDIAILSVAAVSVLAVLAVSLHNEKSLDPVMRLVDTTITNKIDSSSGKERTYWNVKSLQAVVDTGGIGIGMGSSRASSWPIAVLSQLGLIGALLMAALLAVVVRGMGGLGRWTDPETNAVVSSVRASALAGIVSSSISGGSADPGLLFFIALAVISASRVRARMSGGSGVREPRFSPRGGAIAA